MKIVFWGSSEVGCGFLGKLARGYGVAAAVTGPDKAVGRGMGVKPAPVKELALELGIPVYQPEGDLETARVMRKLRPDLCVVAAYGKFIKRESLELARAGFLNIHFSLLPEYRGAAPVQWALINGEKESGVTLFWIEGKMDSGPVFSREKVTVDINDDARSLFAKMIEIGERLLFDALEKIGKGEVKKTPQSGKVSYAPKIEKNFSRLDFSGPAAGVYNKIRGLSLGPRARFETGAGGKKILVQVLKASPPRSLAGTERLETGRVAAIEKRKGIYIKCLDDCVLLTVVQPEGKKPMSAFDFANGRGIKVGDSIAEGVRRKA